MSFFELEPSMTVVELSPGGGWYTEILASYLDDSGTLIAAHFDRNSSNNYLKKNAIHKHALMHLPKPLSSMLENKIKIILIKRDFEAIYQSHKKRNFLRNSLIWYGDMFSFYKFKNEIYLKKKFFNYLTQYYKNWEKYPEELKLEINYADLWFSADKISNFINNNKTIYCFISTRKVYQARANLKEKSNQMTQILERERATLKEQKQIKEELDLARVQLESAKREGNLDKAGEISYGIIPNLEFNSKTSELIIPANDEEGSLSVANLIIIIFSFSKREPE